MVAVSARRSARKLTEDTKKAIEDAFLAYAGSGVPEDALLRMCARHAIGLLELSDADKSDWFEDIVT